MIDNMQYTKNILEKLLNTPSPSGFCHIVMNVIKDEVIRMGYDFEITPKGNGLITLPKVKEDEESLLLTAHVDTLGAMVRSVKSNGMLRFTSVGGFTMNSVEGTYCSVHTRQGQVYTGTILNTSSSVHVYEDARTQERKESIMEIRLDEEVSTNEETQELGIVVGDYISFDSKTVFTPSGYIKSRHLDDKASVACILGLLDSMAKNKLKANKNVKVMFSVFEEVGHGSSYVPEDVCEILAVDMGAIGDDLTCTEKDVSICVKDSSGPYDYEMVGELTSIAKALSLDYALDVYPRYNSDASAALHGGNNVKAALIGPGVHASHSIERTHVKALESTINLMAGYLGVDNE